MVTKPVSKAPNSTCVIVEWLDEAGFPAGVINFFTGSGSEIGRPLVTYDSEYGLSASVLTNNLAEAERFRGRSKQGVVKVNEKTTGLELHVSFGGVKQSSTNTYREQGKPASSSPSRRKPLRQLLKPGARGDR